MAWSPSAPRASQDFPPSLPCRGPCCAGSRGPQDPSLAGWWLSQDLGCGGWTDEAPRSPAGVRAPGFVALSAGWALESMQCEAGHGKEGALGSSLRSLFPWPKRELSEVAGPSDLRALGTVCHSHTLGIQTFGRCCKNQPKTGETILQSLVFSRWPVCAGPNPDPPIGLAACGVDDEPGVLQGLHVFAHCRHHSASDGH